MPFEALCGDVCFVERLGFDNVWVVDDFKVQGVPGLSVREAWTLLAGLATRDPATLRRCYFAGVADEPIFLSNEATGEFIDRYVDAGATVFTF